MKEIIKEMIEALKRTRGKNDNGYTYNELGKVAIRAERLIGKKFKFLKEKVKKYDTL